MGFNRRTWVTTLGCAVAAEAKNEAATIPSQSVMVQPSMDLIACPNTTARFY